MGRIKFAAISQVQHEADNPVIIRFVVSLHEGEYGKFLVEGKGLWANP